MDLVFTSRRVCNGGDMGASHGGGDSSSEQAPTIARIWSWISLGGRVSALLFPVPSSAYRKQLPSKLLELRISHRSSPPREPSLADAHPAQVPRRSRWFQRSSNIRGAIRIGS